MNGLRPVEALQDLIWKKNRLKCSCDVSSKQPLLILTLRHSGAALERALDLAEATFSLPPAFSEEEGF